MKFIKYFAFLTLLSIFAINTIQCMEKSPEQKIPGLKLYHKISPDRKYTMFINSKKTGYLVETKELEEALKKKESFRPIMIFDGCCNSVTFSPNSKMVAYITKSPDSFDVHFVHIFSLEEKKEIFSEISGNSDCGLSIEDMALFSQNSQYFFLKMCPRSQISMHIYKIKHGDAQSNSFTKFITMGAYRHRENLYKEVSSDSKYVLVRYDTNIDILSREEEKEIHTFSHAKEGHFNSNNPKELIIQYIDNSKKVYTINKSKIFENKKRKRSNTEKFDDEPKEKKKKDEKNSQ